MSEHLAQLSGDIASFSLMDVDINSLAEMVALHHGSQRSSNGRLKALQLQLGIMLTPETFACKITCSENVCMTFLENRRMIRIQFRREYETGTVEYQMELKVQDLESGCITIDEDCKSDGNNCSNFNRNSCSSNSHNNSDSKSENATTWVTIRMKIPPTYWRFTRTPPSPDDPSRGGGFNMQNLRRAIDLRAIISSTAVNKSGAPAMSGEPAQPDPPSQKVKLGKWLVVRLEVDLRQNRRSLNSFLKKAREFNLYSSPAAAKHQKITAVVDHTQQQKSSWQDFGIRLRFDVQFMLESVLSHNFILADNVTREFVSLLSTIEPIKACTILENVIGRRTRIWDPFAFLSNEVKRLSGVPIYPRIVPHHNVLLRKVIITPTTMYLLPPTIETSNRIIRKFQEYEDYFLRVEFSDEGPDKIWARGGQVNNALFNRIYATLVNGVKIGERLYEFLAFSSSQLRENAAWFFCSNGDKNPTPDEIRNWMGDFSRIKSIAKYGARMGQCFSSTRPIIELSAEQVKVIDDIEHDGSNFSDGCGMISAALAEFIQNRLDKEVAPSAFQIRLGGSKGVLAVAAQDPERKSPNTDFWVAIRPSMNKFDSNHYVLEVIKTSSFIPSYLNRQIIVLLSALGVPDKVFLDYKDQMVREYDQMETNDIIAYRILAQQWDESGTYRMMSAMIKAGFLKSGDIFLKNLIKLCKHQMLEDLAKRARIFIPDGAFLLGVVDETGTLEENEIFVQVSSIESPNKRRIIEQDCVVVRSPCFHPGDVRVVRAVNNPRLHHLHDVVVFNTKGRRSLPNMCSGGDLDGDEFTIIWDSTIVQCVRQEAPMDYKGQDTLIKDDITIRDVQSFFVQHAVSNNLGIIANAHLSFSDQLPMGPFDGKCLRLAQLHSDAVDFPKTGKPAEIKEELRPKKYPDFMGKSRDRSYRSERILGKLYRDCSNHESFDPLQESLKIDERLLVDGYTEYLEEARALKERHDNEIRSLTNHYGVRSDVEVVSGFITEMDSRSNKREYENRQSIARAYSAIRKTFRQIFDEEFHHKDPIASSPSHPNSLQQRQEQKASAWYAVSYQDWQPGQYYTFGWIVWDILCKIAEKKSAQLTSLPRSHQHQHRHTIQLCTPIPDSKSARLVNVSPPPLNRAHTTSRSVPSAPPALNNYLDEDIPTLPNQAQEKASSSAKSSRMHFLLDGINPRPSSQGGMEHAIAMARIRLEQKNRRQQSASHRQNYQKLSYETLEPTPAPTQQPLPTRNSLDQRRSSGTMSSEDPLFAINTSPALASLSQDSYDGDEMDLAHQHISAPFNSTPPPSSSVSLISLSSSPPLSLSTPCAEKTAINGDPCTTISNANSHHPSLFHSSTPSTPAIAAAARATHFQHYDAVMNEALSQIASQLASMEPPPMPSQPPSSSSFADRQQIEREYLARRRSMWNSTPNSWPDWDAYPTTVDTIDDDFDTFGISKENRHSQTNMSSASSDTASPSSSSASPIVSTVTNALSSSYFSSAGILVVGPDVLCDDLAKILDF